MADPYATVAPDLSGRPTGPPPYENAVVKLGGGLVGVDGSVGAESSFLVVHCRGLGTLAPFARVEPELATLLWLEHSPSERSAERGNALLAELRGRGVPVLAIKQGMVGGPPDREGCLPIDADLVEPLLDAFDRDEIEWEADPDFGYELPGEAPGFDGERARALLPRLLYGDHDRVYEHADLVARKKRERYEIAQSLSGLDPAVARASRWPPAPTNWREA